MVYNLCGGLLVLLLLLGYASTESEDKPSIKVVSLDNDENEISNLQDYLHLIPAKFVVSCNATFPVIWQYNATLNEIPGNTIRFRRYFQGSLQETIFETILELNNPIETNQGWLTCRKRDDVKINTTFFLYVKQKESIFSRFISQDSLEVIKLSRNATRIIFPCLLDGPLDEHQRELLLFRRGGIVRNATYLPHVGFQIDAPVPKNFNTFHETCECRIFHPGIELDENEQYKNIRVFVVVYEKGLSFEAVIDNQVVQSTQRQVYAPQGSTINLFCQDPNTGSKLQIIKWRSRKLFTTENAKHANATMGTAMLELTPDKLTDKDVFACLRRDDDNLQFPTEVLHQWEINFSDSVQLDMEYLEISNRRIIRCKFWNATDPNNMKLRIAKCTTDEQCSWITGSEYLPTGSGFSRYNLQEQKANTSHVLDTDATLFTGWEDIKMSVGRCACEQVQILDNDEVIPCECYQYTAKHTGLVQCTYNPFGSENECIKIPAEGNCNRKTGFVTSGFRASPDDANECVAEAQTNATDQSSSILYFSKQCFNILRLNETYVIKCVGLQGKFAENFHWKVQDKLIFPGSPLTSDDYTFRVSEAYDDVTITSDLTIQTHSNSTPKSFPIECFAEHALNPGSDSIKTTVIFGVPNHPNFKTQVCSSATSKTCPTPESVTTIFCTIGKPCEVNCTTQATSFPKPNFKWYKVEDDCQRNQSFAKMRPNIKVERQSLRFLSFQQDNDGTYLCMSIINSTDNTGTRMDVCRSEYFNIAVADSTWKLALGLGVVIPLCILAVMAAVFYNIRFKKERTRANMLSAREVHEFIHGNPEAINPELDLSEQAYLLPYQMAYEFPFEKLVLGKQLGAGAYGTVVKAEADGILEEGVTTTVAVKTVHANADLTYFKALLKELKVMIHIGTHFNVVNLLGACTVNLKNKQVYIIVEFCCYGNLQQYMSKYRNRFIDQIVNDEIHPSLTETVQYTNIANTSIAPVRNSISLDSRGRIVVFQNPGGGNYCQFAPDSGGSSPPTDSGGGYQPLWRSNVQGDYNELERITITTTTLVNWSYQIATGMEYLALKRIFHGDLAARNVLLAEGGIVKIADFGLARHVYSDINYVKKENCPLPVKWMALESLLRLEFSSQSDVWSFGVLLWEIFTLGRVPYPEVEVSSSFVTTILDGNRLPKPTYATNEIFSLMHLCWADEPLDRPDFSTLREFFRQKFQNLDESTYEELCSLDESAKGKRTKSEAQLELDESPPLSCKFFCVL